MSGYGEQKRRRERSVSSCRSRSRSVGRGGDKRPKGGKKDKKDKKQHREPEPDRRPQKTRRSRSRRREEEFPPPPPQSQAAAAEATLGRTASQASAGSEGKQRSAWREEIARTDSKDEANNMNATEGYVAEEDDEQVNKKLAESRARREALIAKWVNKGENENGQSGTLETHDTPVDHTDSEHSDAEDDDRGAKVAEKQDEATIEKHRDVMKFILATKAEHDDDMFQENADEDALKAARGQSQSISLTGASADDWDDSEGYYKAKIGECMASRYLVVEDLCGKGVFSTVIKAKDQQDSQMVAIKVMRCNDMMRKAAEKEIEVLEKLNKSDKQNKRQVIRLLRHFSYRGHLCLVFECMWDNLRVALKKYTKDKGMSLQAVRAYTKQLLIALRHIHRNHIIHADIKPDNILISAGHNIVKICDMGSAMYYPEEVEPTPYLVSRFYRAPEIVFGAKYGPPCDVFAMGATLYELFTGKILFPGRTNNDMLRLFMETKGKFPHKMIKSGSTWKQHFDDNLDFKFTDTNKATRKKHVRIISDLTQKRDIKDMVLERIGLEKQRSKESTDLLYVKKAKQMSDLLNQMTTLDPEKRVTANDGLQHQFLVEAGPGSKQVAQGAGNTREGKASGKGDNKGRKKITT